MCPPIIQCIKSLPSAWPWVRYRVHIIIHCTAILMFVVTTLQQPCCTNCNTSPQLSCGIHNQEVADSNRTQLISTYIYVQQKIEPFMGLRQNPEPTVGTSWPLTLTDPWALFQYKDRLSSYGNSHEKDKAVMRQSFFIMGILILARRHLHIEMPSAI